MKIIFIILFVALGLVVLALIAALFVKNDYAVEKSVIINKPKTDVFDFLILLKNQNKFSVWAGMDPAMKTEFRGTDGTVGFVSAWDSEDKNVGKGEQEIVQIKPGSRIDYKLRFIKPFKAENDAYLITQLVSDNQTKVTWGFSGRFNYPMNLMMIFMNMEKAIGKDFETGLNNLKGILEK